MKVAFVLPVVSHVRYRKRIEGLMRLGAEATVLAFERDYYAGRPLPGGYTSLGRIRHGHYFSRIIPFVKAILRIRGAARDADIVYSFGLDNLFFAWLATLVPRKRLKLVYEIGDIREILLGRGPVSLALRTLERFLLGRSDFMVVTSAAFFREYYRDFLGVRDLDYLVIENKMDPDWAPDRGRATARRKPDGILRIGYFGLIRCRRSLEILKGIATKGKGRIEVTIRGIFMGGLQDQEIESNSIPGICYAGPYVVPDELAEMYRGIDLIWACYPYQGTKVGNWSWARTNRFYEGCFFVRPMLAQSGTEDGRVIEELNLGLSLPLDDVEGTIAIVLKITDSELEKWRENIVRLPKKVYIYTDEHEKLLERLNTGTAQYGGTTGYNKETPSQ